MPGALNAFIVTPEEELKSKQKKRLHSIVEWSHFSALSMNQPESSRRRRVATAADNAARPVPKSTTVTGSGTVTGVVGGTTAGVGVFVGTGVKVGVLVGTDVFVAGIDVAVGVTGVAVAGSAVGVSATGAS